MVRAAARTTTGTQDFTVSGFGTPKAAMFIMTLGSSDGTAANTVLFSFGATDGTRQWAMSHRSSNGVADTATRRNILNNALVHSLAASITDSIASFDSWITDGVRINWTDPPGGAFLVTVILFGGADVSVYADAIDVPDGSAIDITAPSFEPDLVLGGCVGRTMNSVASDMESSVGFAHNNGTGTVVQRTLFWNEPNAQASGDPRQRLDTSCFGGKYSGGAIAWKATLGSFDSSGFTLTPSASGASDDFGYLALKFDGCASWVGSINSPTSTGNAANTSPGFTPQFVMMALSMLDTEDADEVDDTAGAFGIAAFTASESFCNALAIEDASATTDTQSLSDDQAINLDAHDGTAAYDATLVSMDANGFTLNYSAADGTTRKWFGLAVEEAAGGGGGVSVPALDQGMLTGGLATLCGGLG